MKTLALLALVFFKDSVIGAFKLLVGSLVICGGIGGLGWLTWKNLPQVRRWAGKTMEQASVYQAAAAQPGESA